MKIAEADKNTRSLRGTDRQWGPFWLKALSPYGSLPDEVEELPFDIDVSELHEVQYLFTPLKKLRVAPRIYGMHLSDASYMFADCGELEFVPEIAAPNLSQIAYMFRNCVKLTDGNVTIAVPVPREQYNLAPLAMKGSGLTKPPFVLL